MDFLFELNLSKERTGGSISESLYRQLKLAILDGRLRVGTRLPATRSSRSLLGVSRNTAQEIYDRLAQEGLVSARRGSGTYVSNRAQLPASNVHEPGKDVPERRIHSGWDRPELADWMGFWREDNEPIVPRLADLRPGLIDPALFPHASFRQVMARELRRLETRPASYRSPQGNQGNRRLREAIADHIGLTRAIACSGNDVIVTAGAQQAFDLIARTLIESGKTIVAIEDPGYPPMRVPFAAAGANLVPVPVDAEGMIIEAIPRDAGVICVCPSHQLPLGMSLSLSRRHQLLEFARRTGAVIVEDDYDGEFRYDGSPLEALRSRASSDSVFYVGSFSKSMFPSLRLGFVVPPHWAIAPLVTAKNCADWHCPAPLQLALAAFIREGHLARHVRRIRRIYRDRRDTLLNALAEPSHGALDPIPSFYGMHVAALARGIDCEATSTALAHRGIMIHSLDRYFMGTVTQQGFIFGYAAVDDRRIKMAATALGEELVPHHHARALPRQVARSTDQ